MFKYKGVLVNESWLNFLFLPLLKFSGFTVSKLPSYLKQLPHRKVMAESVVVLGAKEDERQSLKPQVTTFIELSSSCDSIFSANLAVHYFPN